MRGVFLYGLILMIFLGMSTELYAQEMGLQEILTGEKDTREEDKNLEFQTYFFEALYTMILLITLNSKSPFGVP